MKKEKKSKCLGGGWNYRFVRIPDGKEWFYQIYEVYYTKHGPGAKICAWSADPIPPGGGTAMDIMEDLILMSKAFYLPVCEFNKEKWLVEVEVSKITGKKIRP